MNRRLVLRLLALSGLLLSPLGRKALAEAAKPTTEPPVSIPPIEGPQGLPSDFHFVAPRRWGTVDAQLARKLDPTLRDSSPIDIGGIGVTRAGKIETGKLDPIGQAVDLPASLDGIVLPADQALSLEVLNREFNPYVSDPRAVDGKPLVGPFTKGGEVYQGKTFLPVRLVMKGMLDTMEVLEEAAQPLLGALSELVAIRTPVHEFRLGPTLGNRVVFYGTDTVNGEEIGHTHIDQVVFTLAEKKLRLLKQMVHFDKAGQGGAPDAIVTDGVAGSTHVGGFSEGFAEGVPISVKSDWPHNYGKLGDGNRTYNAHLLAIDYTAGTHDPIPEAALDAYYRNADMWDCCAAILVPFADQDPDPIYRDYTYNPLEVYDQKSAREIAAALAELDAKQFLAKHGAFYCAEGQYVVANLGPQEDEAGGTLLKQSRYSNTKFGALIANFLKAPGYAGMSAEERRRNPSIGWDYLVELGPENGGISQGQFMTLTNTDRQGIALDWIPEDIKGWQAYRPKDAEALIARPMTVATLAWALLRLYMPRELVAQAVAEDIVRAYATGDARVKATVQGLIGGAEPGSPAGRTLIAGLAAKAATGLLLGLLSSEEVQQTLLFKAGFNDITNDEDKARVLAAYQEFLAILQNADYSSQSSLDAALAEADARFAKLDVTRTYYNRTTRERVPAQSMVMRYAAPPCFGMWAQQPFLAGTGCLRYVATAMHASQKKSAPA